MFIVIGPLGLSMQTMKKQKCAEVSWQNNICKANCSIETRLEYGFAIENAYFT